MTTKTIKPSGGDYTTLTAWEAATQGDFVTAAQGQTAECYTFSGGLLDHFTIAGSTVDATYHHTITAAAGNRHNGVARAGFYIKNTVSFQITLTATNNHVRLEYLGAWNTSGYTAVLAGAGNLNMEWCIVESTGANGIDWQASSNSVANSCAFVGTTGSNVYLPASTGVVCTNCVAANAANGFNVTSAGDMTVVNCVSYNHSTGNYASSTSGTYNAACANNATASASDDAPGANSVLNIASGDFNNAAANDFHLSGTGSALYHVGVPVSGVVYDVDGDAYDASTPSIGFDEVISGGGGTDLVIANAAHAHAVDSPAFTQTHILALANALHAHAADNVTLSADITLSVNAGTHAHAGDSPSLTQTHILALANAAHAHAADSPAFTQTHILALANAAHAHAVDNVTLAADITLAVNAALHGHTADVLALTQTHVLIIAAAAHAHAADAPSLTQTHILTVANAAHAHAADNVTLSGAGDLAVQNAAHAHAAGNVDLTQVHALTIAAAMHAHMVDSVALTQAHVLAIQAALHAHAAGNLDLTLSGFNLVVDSALHAHIADALALTQVHILIVSDAMHAHIAENLGLSTPAELHRISNRILRIAFEDRTLVIVAESRLWRIQ